MLNSVHKNPLDKGLKIIDFQMLPITAHTLRLDDAILMDDNLDNDRILTSTNLLNYTPVKLMMSVVLLCVNGNIKTVVNQVENILQKGDLLTIMPGAIIEKILPSPDCKIAICAMAYHPDKSFEQAPTKSQIEIGRIVLSNANPALFQLDEEFTKTFIDLYKAEREIFKHTVPELLEESIKNYIQTLACMISSWTKNKIPAVPVPANREAEIFKKFMNDIHLYASKERHVSFYADRACLSPKYFARIITKTSGHKPSHWIKNYVILEAKSMLGTGVYTIQQVSDKLSFPNPSFFCKYFKDEVGISPGQYIKKVSLGV